MIKLETLKELEWLEGFQTVVYVISMETIQLSIKVKNKDFLPDGFSSRRIIKKFQKANWITSLEECHRILDITFACQEFEQREALVGLGGCVSKSLEEIIKFYSFIGEDAEEETVPEETVPEEHISSEHVIFNSHGRHSSR